MNRLLFCVASLGISFLNVPVFGKLTTPVIFSPANNTINAPTGMQLEVESQSVVKYAFEYSESSTMKNAVRVEVARDNYYTRTWLNKLKLSTTYYWRVKSITAKDSSDWTATYNFKTTSIIQRYAPAKNFVKNSASYANVSCYRVAGIDTFEFQFDTTSRFNSFIKRSVIIPDTFKWFYIENSPRDFNYGDTIYWRVRGISGNSVKWTDTGSFIIFDTITPKYPTTAFLQDVKISFEFTGVYYKEAFQVQIDTSKYFDSPLLIDTIAREGTKQFDTDPFSIVNLNYETYYYYRVRAVNKNYTSRWSYSAFTTKGYSNDIVIAENYADPMVSISVRTKIGGTEAYEIQLDTTASFNSPEKQVFFSKSGIDTARDLFFGKVYYARARPVHVKDSGLWSRIRPINILKYPYTQYPYPSSVVQITDSLQFATRTGMDGFQIQVTSNNGFDKGLFLDTVISNFKFNSSHLIKGLLFRFNTNYLWRIRAWHDRDTSGWSIPSKFNTVNSPKPLTPTNSNFLGTGTTTLFSWEALKGVSSYQLMMDTSASFNSPYVLDTVITGTIFKRESLLFRPVYYWKIRAVTQNDTSQWSNPWLFKVLPVKLNYPKNNITDLTLTSLDWNSINGTTGYILEVDTNSNFPLPLRIQDTATNSFFHYFMETPDLVGFNTKCFWRVKLFHTVDTSEWSTVWNFTTKPRRAPILVSPTDSTVKVSVFAQLKWQAYSGASSYAVQYSENSNFSNAVKTTSVSTTLNVSLKSNTRYYWRVRGRNSAGDEFYDFSETWTFTTDSGLPKPVLVSPVNTAQNQALNVVFSWGKVSQATSYRVEISKDKTFNLGVFPKNTTTNSTSFTHLAGGTTYYWRVKSINGSLESPWSEVWSMTTNVLNTVGEFAALGVEVFPNPSSGIYQIRLNAQNWELTRVTDVLGREMNVESVDSVNWKKSVNRDSMSSENTSDIIDLDITNFPRGTYLIHINTERGLVVVHVVKE